jgi:hypothetical protein
VIGAGDESGVAPFVVVAVVVPAARGGATTPAVPATLVTGVMVVVAVVSAGRFMALPTVGTAVNVVVGAGVVDVDDADGVA